MEEGGGEERVLGLSHHFVFARLVAAEVVGANCL